MLHAPRNPLVAPPLPAEEADFGLTPIADARRDLGFFTGNMYRRKVEKFLNSADEQAFYIGLGGVAARHLGDVIPIAEQAFVPPRNWRQRKVAAKVGKIAGQAGRDERISRRSAENVSFLNRVARHVEVTKPWVSHQLSVLEGDYARGAVEPIAYAHEREHLVHAGKGTKIHPHFRTLRRGEAPLISTSVSSLEKEQSAETLRGRLAHILKLGEYDEKIMNDLRTFPGYLSHLESRHQQWQDTKEKGKQAWIATREKVTSVKESAKDSAVRKWQDTKEKGKQAWIATREKVTSVKESAVRHKQNYIQAGAHGMQWYRDRRDARRARRNPPGTP